MRGGRFFVAATLVVLLVAGVASHYASSAPDGLESVARTTGFADTAEDSPTSAGPFADYQTKGVGQERLGGGLAGIAGVVVVLVLMSGVVLAVRRRRPTDERS